MSTDADFEWKEIIGRGAYGEVHRARDKRRGEVVAIKTIPRANIDCFVIEEVQNLSKCHHPQIIQFREAFVTDKHLAIVMELASGGDLHTFMSRQGRLSEKQARWLFQQLMTGVEYCHSQNIIVRDLKLENTLLVAGLRNDAKISLPLIKIADFGVSKSSPHSMVYTKNVGTPGYTAPEILQGSGSYNGAKCDIWSAGVLLWLLVFGQHPFVDLEDVQKGSFKNTHARITRCLYTFPKDVTVSEELKDLLKRIFVAASKDRISMDEIFTHPWFVKDLPPAVLETRKRRTKSTQNLDKLNQVIAESKVRISA